MFLRIWAKVVHGSYHRSEAVIHGFQRRRIRDRIYPALIRNGETAAVEGFVYFEVDAADIERLDRFEGKIYERLVIPCILEGGGRTDAGAYLLKDSHRLLLLDEDWDPQWFEREAMEAFIATYSGFSSPGSDGII